ncbi:cyclin-dependent protein kinase complex component [Phlyctema vagabunda]|uniref:Cyclin-dependent protein kinase complex component n=1 Tax=Phlyctema vagabunda TaxID=108571 RepID=A0ABR4P3L0_9HELO
MAAVISDFVSDSSRFHTHSVMAGSGHQHSAAEYSNDSQYRQRSRSRADPPSPKQRPASVQAGTPPPSVVQRATDQGSADDTANRNLPRASNVKAAHPPSPPKSSSPMVTSYTKQPYTSQQHFPEASAPFERREIPPGAVDEKTRHTSTAGSAKHDPIARSVQSSDDFKKYGGNTIKVRDLAHIQDFASEEFLSYRGQSGRRRTADDPTLKYEISGMPITDIIEMVAGLLTKITTTNDRQHENLHRSLPSEKDSANMTGTSSSVLAFHGKNVPSITILSYLSRIHKYCPTTYEVFLSLLVYFDRMTERVNAAPIEAMRRDSMDQDISPPSTGYSADGSDLADSPPSSRSISEHNEDAERAPQPEALPFPLSHFFVVDSFNIHRLVIAGVTCASKFFSDVFYTNSRYAKVGGLPLAELNHLELQFLLLNDFRLSVPVEELEAYGTMLVEFYAREVIAQRQGSMPSDMAYPDDQRMSDPSSP